MIINTRKNIIIMLCFLSLASTITANPLKKNPFLNTPPQETNTRVEQMQEGKLDGDDGIKARIKPAKYASNKANSLLAFARKKAVLVSTLSGLAIPVLTALSGNPFPNYLSAPYTYFSESRSSMDTPTDTRVLFHPKTGQEQLMNLSTKYQDIASWYGVYQTPSSPILKALHQNSLSFIGSAIKSPQRSHFTKKILHSGIVKSKEHGLLQFLIYPEAIIESQKEASDNKKHHAKLVVDIMKISNDSKLVLFDTTSIYLNHAILSENNDFISVSDPYLDQKFEVRNTVKDSTINQDYTITTPSHSFKFSVVQHANSYVEPSFDFLDLADAKSQDNWKKARREEISIILAKLDNKKPIYNKKLSKGWASRSDNASSRADYNKKDFRIGHSSLGPNHYSGGSYDFILEMKDGDDVNSGYYIDIDKIAQSENLIQFSGGLSLELNEEQEPIRMYDISGHSTEVYDLKPE